MIPIYLKTKTCRLCRYYEQGENFCAVAPDYIGKAHLCEDFELAAELALELDGEEGTEDPRTLIYEQFAKDYLKRLLSPYGEVESGRTLTPSTPADIDLWFAPRVSPLPAALGLLAVLAGTRVLFEPYRNPLTPDEFQESLLKLLEVRGEFERAAAREGVGVPESDLPHLWILTPAASESLLRETGAEEKEGEERGVYFLPRLFLAGLVVLDRLPPTEGTLWLRLLGRGVVQLQAIEELEALNACHPLRPLGLESFYGLLERLEGLPEKDGEDLDLMERLRALARSVRHSLLPKFQGLP